MTVAQKQKYTSTVHDRSPEINSCTYDQLNSNKGGMNIYEQNINKWQEYKNDSLISGAVKIGQLHVKG